MPCLTIRDIPSAQLRRIKSEADANHRSLNGQILAMIDSYLGALAVPGAEAPRERIRKASQAEALRGLMGTWEDSRSREEIVRDIVDSRTAGREVSL